MNLSPHEQANAVYFLRKVRQLEFAQKVNNTHVKLAELQADWARLEELFIEEARLQDVARMTK